MPRKAIAILLNNLFINILFLSFICFVGSLFFSHSKKRNKNEKVVVNISEYQDYQDDLEEPTPNIEIEDTLPEPVAVKPGYESDDTPLINQNSGFDRVSPSLDEAISSRPINNINNDYSEFTPLVFNNGNHNPFQSFNNPIVPPIKEEPVATPTSLEVEDAFEEEEEETDEATG